MQLFYYKNKEETKRNKNVILRNGINQSPRPNGYMIQLFFPKVLQCVRLTRITQLVSSYRVTRVVGVRLLLVLLLPIRAIKVSDFNSRFFVERRRIERGKSTVQEAAKVVGTQQQAVHHHYHHHPLFSIRNKE